VGRCCECGTGCHGDVVTTTVHSTATGSHCPGGGALSRNQTRYSGNNITVLATSASLN